MKRNKTITALLVLASMMSAMGSMNAQAQKREAPDWRKLHYLSEEEMNTPVRRHSLNFTESPAPTEAPRFVAEFEPMQGVPTCNTWPEFITAILSLTESASLWSWVT